MLGGASSGRDGAGGSIAFAEPHLGGAFSDVINPMIATHQEDRRTAALMAAARECADRCAPAPYNEDSLIQTS